MGGLKMGSLVENYVCSLIYIHM